MKDVLRMILVLDERMKELQAEVIEFTTLEVEATDEFEMLRYAYRANEARALLNVVKEYFDDLMLMVATC